MKKFILSLIVASAPIFSVGALAQKDIRTYSLLDSVMVIGVRATAKTPMSVQEIAGSKLKTKNFSQDMPALLSGATSLTFTSDAGSGLGYTSLSLRGIDASRININANGVPVNDSESHSVFWVNMPNFVSSLKNVQIIRGAGVSTHSAGAFGGAINMQSEDLTLAPGGDAQLTYGAFNTFMTHFGARTGRILNNKVAASIRLSKAKSDGFVDRAFVDLNSYQLQAAYYGDNSVYRLIHFGGSEKTGIAWNGISKKQWDKFGPTYNNAGIMPPFEGASKDASTFYPSADNYKQHHTHFIATNHWKDGLKTQLTFHYTRGKGFINEYRTGRKLVQFGLPNFKINDETIKKRDLIREKWLDNHFFGGIFNLEAKDSKNTLSVGVAGNHYNGKHYGFVPYVRDYPVEVAPNHRYYDNIAHKTDLSAYIRDEWNVKDNLTLYSDIMVRHIGYDMKGVSDKYNDVTKAMDILDVHPRYTFFLPKYGATWTPAPGHRFYASVSMAAREPNRKAYIESPMRDHQGKVIYPNPEKMIDYELGYSFRSQKLTAEINGYYMDYTDQLVPDGRLSDVGDVLLINIPESYRMGVELALEYRPFSWLTYSGNLMLSRNILKSYEHTHAVYDADWNFLNTTVEKFSNTPIANSPDHVWNQTIALHNKGWYGAISAHGQGGQYLDNTGSKDRYIDGFMTLSAQLSYSFRILSSSEATISLQANNLLNTSYSATGYIYDAGKIIGKDGKESYYADLRYFPQAGRHIMSTLRVTF
ncbi:MAG: TonB-dependent receptor [Porphyromonas sp.]|nr:TonB-dependent receptor [Porphyromonas sp.]